MENLNDMLVISENFLMRMSYSKEYVKKSVENNFYAIRIKMYLYNIYCQFADEQKLFSLQC